MEIYRNELADYLNKILLFNSWYYTLKIKKKQLNLDSTNVSLDEKLPSSFLKLEISNIESNYTLNCIKKKFDKAIPVTDEEVTNSYDILSAKKLSEALRGKYMVTFLIKFIDFLTMDSKNNKTILKENINFTTNKNIVLSHLATYASTPNCLNNYLNSFLRISKYSPMATKVNVKEV